MNTANSLVDPLLYRSDYVSDPHSYDGLAYIKKKMTKWFQSKNIIWFLINFILPITIIIALYYYYLQVQKRKRRKLLLTGNDHNYQNDNQTVNYHDILSSY